MSEKNLALALDLYQIVSSRFIQYHKPLVVELCTV